jgi:hypothetical protein
MTLGLILQAVGLGWLALIAEPDVGYGTLAMPLIVAGVGISMCFPTVGNAVVASMAAVGVLAAMLPPARPRPPLPAAATALPEHAAVG